MFKKLVNILFEEEEVVDFENSYEEEEKEQEFVTKTRQQIKESHAPKKVQTESVELPKRTSKVYLSETKVEPKEAEEVVVEQKRVRIDLDPVATTPRSTRYNKPSTEYEFTKVISPIFGVKEEDVKTLDDFVSAPTPKRKQDNNSLLGTVISPIYGVNKEVKHTETSAIQMEQEIDNISLDDLIQTEEPVKTPVVTETMTQTTTEFDTNDFDSLIRTLEEEAHEEMDPRKIIESSRLNLFDDMDE